MDHLREHQPGTGAAASGGGGSHDAQVHDAVSDDAVHDDAAHDDAVHDDAVHDDAVHDDAVHDDAVHDDAVHDDAVSGDAVHNAQVHDAVSGAQVSDAVHDDAVSGPALLKHQDEAVDRIHRGWEAHGAFALFDDMGMGKTISVLAAIDALPEARRVLVLAPLAVLAQWCDEAKTWAPDCVCTHDEPPSPDQAGRTLTVCTHASVTKPWLQATHWDVVVVDEAHVLKNWKCKGAAAVVGLHATRRVVLTGTPMQNHERDVYAVLSLARLHPSSMPGQNRCPGIGSTLFGAERVGTLNAPGRFQAACDAVSAMHITASKARVHAFAMARCSLLQQLRAAQEAGRCPCAWCAAPDSHEPVPALSAFPVDMPDSGWAAGLLAVRMLRPPQRRCVLVRGLGAAGVVCGTHSWMTGAPCDPRLRRLMQRHALSRGREEASFTLPPMHVSTERVEMGLQYSALHLRFMMCMWGSEAQMQHCAGEEEQWLDWKQIDNLALAVDLHAAVVQRIQGVLHAMGGVQRMDMAALQDAVGWSARQGCLSGDIVPLRVLTAWQRSTVLPCLPFLNSAELVARLRDRCLAGRTGQDIYRVWRDMPMDMAWYPNRVLQSGGPAPSSPLPPPAAQRELGDHSDRDAPQPPVATHAYPGLFSPKIARLVALLHSTLAEGITLVFSCSLAALYVAAEHVAASGLRVGVLDGSASAAERTRVVASMAATDGTAPQVVMCSMRAMSAGVNMTAARHVVFLEPSWNPFSGEQQAMARVHRMGQRRETTCTFMHAVASGGSCTFDEYVTLLQEHKNGAVCRVLSPSRGVHGVCRKELSVQDRKALVTAMARIEASRTRGAQPQ